MTSINDELYQALIEAGTSNDKARAAAKSVAEQEQKAHSTERSLTKISTDIFWIKTTGAGAVALIVTLLGVIIAKLP